MKKLNSYGPVSFCSIFWPRHMIVNIDNIVGNERQIAAKEDVKVAYTQD